ncbi:UBX domain-containing protein 1 [Liparis tanakae]|uniref:UBX domain-containing protein 1 n=1 Tax=Liparis tanakae TaxID=230148 RepID=A0A4Z2F0I0_9TELE|nr:UBX domain-containing protein 1 [Liparis tanakae]
MLDGERRPTTGTAGGDGSCEDEDTSARMPMSEEEKLDQVRRLEELMRVKQAERRERERAEELEREKQRRRQGQELQHIRQKLQDDDMKKLTDQRMKEKMEDKMARQRVKDKIARDREERAQKGQDFTLLSPYPRHVYTELDMEKPLKELGLVPSGVLVVAKK